MKFLTKYQDKIIATILMFVCVFLFCVAYKTNNTNSALSFSVTNLASITITIIFSYFFVQRKTDERMRKDLLIKSCNAVQEKIELCLSIDYCELNYKVEFFTKKRKLSNKIGILEVYATQLDNEHLTVECHKVRKAFNEYEEFVGDHIDDQGHLKNSKIEIEKYLGSVDDQIDRLKTRVY